MTSRLPPVDLRNIGPETPLRLNRAVELAFPDGGMTVSGLRREASKGRLTIEVIAGKQFTTLRAIELMREKCRVMQKEPDCGSNQKNGTATETLSGAPHGSSASAPGDRQGVEGASPLR
jgi:hypothetical protein